MQGGSEVLGMTRSRWLGCPPGETPEVGVWGLKTETEQQRLSFGHAIPNGDGMQWREVLGCWR